MSQVADTVLILVLLSVLSAFSASRIPTLINIVAFQGVVVSLIPVLIGPQMDTGKLVFTGVTLLIRGVVIPAALLFEIRRVAIRRKVLYIVGPHVSLMAALGLIVAAFYISSRIDIVVEGRSQLLLPTAIALLVAGMFLLMSRRNSIAMILGYMMMENGIYLGGATFSVRAHHIVELGILLDVLAGVMLMAMILQNIRSTPGDVDTTVPHAKKD